MHMGEPAVGPIVLKWIEELFGMDTQPKANGHVWATKMQGKQEVATIDHLGRGKFILTINAETLGISI